MPTHAPRFSSASQKASTMAVSASLPSASISLCSTSMYTGRVNFFPARQLSKKYAASCSACSTVSALLNQ